MPSSLLSKQNDKKEKKETVFSFLPEYYFVQARKYILLATDNYNFHTKRTFVDFFLV